MSDRTFVMRYVTVKDFLTDDTGACCGILAKRWPDGKELRIGMDMRTEKAKNPRRPNFASLRFNPHKVGRDPFRHKLEPGGMLRLRLFTDPDNTSFLTTDWPNVLTWNAEETASRMRFGQGLVKNYTPNGVWNKLVTITKHSEGKARIRRYMQEHSGTARDAAIEAILAEEMPGYERFKSVYYLYDPDASFRALKGDAGERELREKLLAYFSEECFAPFETENRAYRPVKPNLILRFLDEEKRIQSVREFVPQDSLVFERHADGSKSREGFLSPEQCTEKVITTLKGVLRDAPGYWDILPGHVYTGSMDRMRMGEGQNDIAINHVKALHDAGCIRDASGQVHSYARPMGIKLAKQGSGVVVEAFLDREARLINPKHLTKHGDVLVHGVDIRPKEEASLSKAECIDAEATACEEGPRQ